MQKWMIALLVGAAITAVTYKVKNAFVYVVGGIAAAITIYFFVKR